MCGITGFVNFNLERPSCSVLRKMTEVVSYRGPDDMGEEIIGNCALGNRRLAVIDLSAKAHQPMWDDQKKFCLTFNGEIYNYRELKRQLEKKGCRFFSTSDTEVVLNLYKKYGHVCLEKLRGMFAFAIWDVVKKELFLARDQFGIKPLHFFSDNQVFVFGSEIKSILLHPRIVKIINPRALSHYFSLGFGCIASPETIFEGIYKLPPGYWARLSKKRLVIKPYWDIAKVKPRQIPLEEAVVRTKELLEKSVQSQLMADVPLGVFLSGGIDSSLIAALAQKGSFQPLKTFSIGFKDKQFDESRYAKRISTYLHTQHYHRVFTARDLLQTLPKVVEKLDEPLADASILPTYLLAEFARKEVRVALSGDGGDELFAGYPTYLAHQMATYFNCLPKSVLGLSKNLLTNFGPMLKSIPFLKHSPSFPLQFKMNRFFNGLDKDISRQYLNFMGPITVEKKRSLLIDQNEVAVALTQALVRKVKNRDLLTQLLYLDFKLYLAEDGLVKTDRASSFNSLEVRPPFLDVGLAEFVFSLPSDYKIHRLVLKYLLKKVARGFLPPEVINRPKKGFGIPTHLWLRRELRSNLKSLLEERRLQKQGLFNPKLVNQILNEHLEGAVDHRMVLWNLFIFQLWYNRWR